MSAPAAGSSPVILVPLAVNPSGAPGHRSSSRSATSPEGHCTLPVTTSMPVEASSRRVRAVTTVSATVGTSSAAASATPTTMRPSAVLVEAEDWTV